MFSHNFKFLPLIFSVIIAITRDYISVYKDIFFQINFDKCYTVYTSLHLYEQVFSHNSKFLPLIFSVIIAITRGYMSAVYKDIFFQINFDKCYTVYTSLYIIEQVFSHNFKFVPINTPLCILRSTVVNEYAKNQYEYVSVGNDNNTSMLRMERASTPEKYKENLDVSSEGPSLNYPPFQSAALC